MDPNETLRLIRATVAQMSAESATSPEFRQHALDLAVHVTDLDTWLVKGGFLPASWTAYGELAR